MAKKIEDCKGLRVHAARCKVKRNGKMIEIIVWRANYKKEGKWCNSIQELNEVVFQVTPVMLHGEQFKTWKVGKDGWQINSPEAEEREMAEEQAE